MKRLVDDNYVASIDPLAVALLGVFSPERATGFVDSLHEKGFVVIEGISGWLASRTKNLTVREDFPYKMVFPEDLPYLGSTDIKRTVIYADRLIENPRTNSYERFAPIKIKRPCRWDTMSVFELLANSWKDPAGGSENSVEKSVQDTARSFREGDIGGNTYYVNQTLNTLRHLGIQYEHIPTKPLRACGSISSRIKYVSEQN